MFATYLLGHEHKRIERSNDVSLLRRLTPLNCNIPTTAVAAATRYDQHERSHHSGEGPSAGGRT